ncbi:MAG: tyrosine decarboxylase MfnA [Staphylothermus sp.]|nr:tyrosine decarboxylase MfnA [Staphylothermus sp.]
MNKKIAEIISKLLGFYNETPKHYEGKILGSMTTHPHSLAVYAYNLFIHTNYGDPYIFSTLKNMEDEILIEISKWYGETKLYGYITSGGTESNFLSMISAMMKSNCKNKIVLVPDTVHVSIIKASKLLGFKLISIPTNNSPVDPGVLENYVRKYDPCITVVTAGTTELGLIDPVREVAKIAFEYSVYMHVDAAYGGLLIPFLYKAGKIKQDLKFYEGVSSISIDFHKNGLTPIPSGIILYKNKDELENTCFEANYTLYGKYCGLLGTRPGGSVASIWAMIKYFGYEGYYKQANNMFELARYTYEKLQKIKDIYVYKPILPIVVFKHRKIPYTELLYRLVQKGYYLYKSPSVEGLRVVIMPHHRKEHIDEFVRVLQKLVNERR